MEQHPYWQKQTPEKPLFPDIEWAKPEQKSQAGRLGIIGGNKLGFMGVAERSRWSLFISIISQTAETPRQEQLGCDPRQRRGHLFHSA